MRYIPKYFKSYELLPPDIYENVGDNGLYLIDDRILYTLDAVREFFNSTVTVNNWKHKGKFSQRGYRNIINPKTPNTAHRFGRAVDFEISGITSQQFRDQVVSGTLNKILIYITRIEDGVDWNHVDCMGLPRKINDTIEFFHA